MDLLILTLCGGVLLGAVYGLFSVGFALQFGTLNLVNFTHGISVVWGMYAGYFAIDTLGMHPLVAIALIGALFFPIGMLTYRVVFNRLSREIHEIQLVATVALASALTAAAQAIFGSTAKSLPLASEYIDLGGGIVLAKWKIGGAVTAVVLMSALWFALQRTRWGRDIRASVDDATAAELQGIDTRRSFTNAFGLGMATAGAAGATLVTFYAVQPLMGVNLLILAFGAVLVGGVGSFPGAFGGALVIGVVQQVSATYTAADLQDVFVFLLFIGFLILRPTGMFAKRVRTD